MNFLSKDQINKITNILKQLLADETILYIKTRNAHWNVEGPDFQTAHVFFETQYNELQLVIDEVAEKIRTKDVYAPATIGEYLQLTHLKENKIDNYDSLSFMKELLNDYEIIIAFLNASIKEIEDLNDVSTSDYLVGLLEQHQKTAWMLRSHLK